MQIWNIFEDKATHGIQAQVIPMPNFDLVGIVLGEEGRGRQLTIVPVDLLPDDLSRFRSGESVLIKHAELGETRSGKPKLRQWAGSNSNAFIAILRTPYGYRGDNEHTGDLDADGNALPFPGQVLARGYCADGAAGRMGGGEHIIAVIPTRTVFRARIGGRRYGAPDEYFYYHDGTTLYAFSREDREAADLF
jgi:hypothetical protein